MEQHDTPSTRIQFYGRRKGKTLRPYRSTLVDSLLPSITITPERLAEERSSYKAVWFEVGFGGGEHLAEQALAHPDILMIGCEPFINGVATLLSRIDRENIKNIRLHAQDARPLMDALPAASLDRVFVLFNDPWPKTRHAERRFIGPDNIARLHRLMPQGAELRLASDHPILIKWMVQQMRARSHLFKWQINQCHEWLHRPTDWPPTRYEQKAISEGRKPVYLKFIRL